jgi:hypothetical protein
MWWGMHYFDIHRFLHPMFHAAWWVSYFNI